MEPTRVVLIPQLPIKLRYQEWWPGEFRRELSQRGFDVTILGNVDFPFDATTGGFSHDQLAIDLELTQMRQYEKIGPDHILLHCDLSYPGLFHNVLAHRRPARSAVFCHASAKNRYDVFQPIRGPKWAAEAASARFYDKVLVATGYHARKLKLPNTVVMGALPHPPEWILPTPPTANHRDLRLVSVARPGIQKVDREVERQIYQRTGIKVVRETFDSWRDYYRFLDRSRFLVVTSREETYGYQIVDALLRGCVPIAPDAYSYPELLPTSLLYDPSGTAKERVERILEVVNKQQGNTRTPALKCDNNARSFYDRLAKELTEW